MDLPKSRTVATDLAIADDSLYEIGVMPPTLKIARERKSSNPMPSYQSEHAAGIDLMADLADAIEMAPRERRAVPTGIAVEIPVGYEGQVRPRSGRAIKDGLTLVNSPRLSKSRNSRQRRADPAASAILDGDRRAPSRLRCRDHVIYRYQHRFR